MSNKLTKEKDGKQKRTNRADQPDYETLESNICDFTNTALLVEEAIKGQRNSDDKFDLTMTTDGRTPVIKWASMKTVAHFNLGVALELMLKYLLLRNGKDYPRGREGHDLTFLHDKLPEEVQKRLEPTYQECQMGHENLQFRLMRQTDTKPLSNEDQPISTLKTVFKHFVQDVQLSEKRYFWESTKQQGWRYYFNDLSPFAKFIRRVMENWQYYVVPEAGVKHGGHTEEQGIRANKGEGMGPRKTDEDPSIKVS